MTHRCHWVNEQNPLYVAYHDREWGVPVHDDRVLLELLILESFQAGLSWECILNKREAFRQSFDHFDARRISEYTASDIERLMQNTAIVRHRRKIQAMITNARVFLQIQQEYGSFDRYIWGFTDGKTIIEPYTARTYSPLSERLSRDLYARGMRFVGATIIYSYLQAIGVLYAHGEECAQYIHP